MAAFGARASSASMGAAPPSQPSSPRGRDGTTTSRLCVGDQVWVPCPPPAADPFVRGVVCAAPDGGGSADGAASVGVRIGGEQLEFLRATSTLR